MTPALIFILLVGAAVGCWATLALLGGERARQLAQIEARRAAAVAATQVISVSSTGGTSQPAAHRKTKPKPAKRPAAGADQKAR